MKPAKIKSLWIKGYLYPVKDETGELRQIMLIQENITEGKLYEEYLER